MKKRRKLKKKNCIILIIILLCIISPFFLIKRNNKNERNEKETNNKQEIIKDNSFEQTSKIKYYLKENDQRYHDYRKLNPSMDKEKILLEVNMNLDYSYYQNSKPAPNQNTKDVLVNKYYYLSNDYVPNDLEQISKKYTYKNISLVNYAKESFERMAEDAKKEGLKILALSTFRDYNYQKMLYDRYTRQDGKEMADKYSARPGYSEHQTGLAVDVYNDKVSYTSFENTKEFTWMQENAHKYGYILRFPKDKIKETGYQYESWHYRYVGIDKATFIKENNLCLEEYYAMNEIKKEEIK